MRLVILLSLGFSMLTQVAYSSNTIVFKPEFMPKNSGFSYAIALIMLLIILFIFAKKLKPSFPSSTACQLIEKKHLGNKTVLYIVEYQEQRFLLADNQHALALHALKHETPDAHL